MATIHRRSLTIKDDLEYLHLLVVNLAAAVILQKVVAIDRVVVSRSEGIVQLQLFLSVCIANAQLIVTELQLVLEVCQGVQNLKSFTL